MQTHFIEASHGGTGNWGKFMVARMTDEEFARTSYVEEFDTDRPKKVSLLHAVGWADYNIIVFDLQTREGAAFRPGGYAPADLHKHRIWVCPLFEPFLTWLYHQDLSDITKLPSYVCLRDAPFSDAGYRRPGPTE